MFKRYLVLFLVLCFSVSFSASPRRLKKPHPGWQVLGDFSPGNLPPGGHGYLDLYYYDVSEAPGSATISDTLPEGVTSAGEGVTEGTSHSAGCTGTGTRVVTCQVEVGPGSQLLPSEIGIPVSIAPGLSGEATDLVSMGGPGAPSVEHASIPAHFSSTPTPFGLAAFDAFASEENGTIDTQAGSHPSDFTVAFALNTVLQHTNGEEQEFPAAGQVRDIDVKLPPGLVGDAQAIPKCPRASFDISEFGGEHET